MIFIKKSFVYPHFLLKHKMFTLPSYLLHSTACLFIILYAICMIVKLRKVVEININKLYLEMIGRLGQLSES